MILGTAGHIDHGKTALVRALTGVDTDRLPEERRRGITIDLGFAPLVMDDGETLGVVDVPGHDAFVRTMLAGATGIDLALLVIASDEGVMPQTREHLTILSLLGVRGGVVALSKSDLVDKDWRQLVESDVRTLLEGTPLASAPIVSCSALTGDGLAELRAALIAAARAAPARDTEDLFRLPIDRAFSVRGTGTVVTGTQWSGSIGVDDTVRLFPGDRVARVRSLESHGAKVERSSPGTRVAVALGGLDRDEVGRGSMLVREGDPWRGSALLRADVALLPGAPTLSARTAVRFHLGTSEVGARLTVAARRLAPDASSAAVPARLFLDQAVVVRAGDRFVLRSSSLNTTIGGGIVTDTFPPSHRAKPWPAAGLGDHARLALILAEHARDGLALSEFVVRLGIAPNAVANVVRTAPVLLTPGDRLFSLGALGDATSRLETLVKAWHVSHPADLGVPIQHAREQLRVHAALFDAARAQLSSTQRIETREAVLATFGRTAAPSSAADLERKEKLLARLRSAGAEPPSVSELDKEVAAPALPLLRLLLREGSVVAVGSDRYYASECLAGIRDTLRQSLTGVPPKTASQLKESLGLSRKYLIPLLEYFDREGLTRRQGDLRSLGSGAISGRPPDA